MRALILADGDAPTRDRLDAAWPGWDDDLGLVVAADGGARHAASLGLGVDRWIGDADSIDPADLARLEAAGVPVHRVARDKDASDTELALRLALDAAPDAVTVIGALGGPRLDHAMANLGLPALIEIGDVPIVLLSDAARVGWLRASDAAGGPARWPLVGKVGGIVTLLPLGAGVAGVTTHGLRYPLVDEPLPAGTTRGLSNVIETDGASVTVREGTLLVIEVPATLDR